MAASIFVGRARELGELERLCEARPSLVTLWGPGGVGKTRLAREHAAREASRGARVVWMDLSACRVRADVVAALAPSLGVSGESSADAAASLARAAAAQRALIVADEAERVDAEGRALLGAIARAGSRVLVTSRDPLGEPDEHVLTVAVLPEDDAAELFVALAGGSRSPGDPAVVREIVRRLDGLPLAIDLAAKRAPILGAQGLLDRLDRKLDVLATLRSVIASSWEQLTGDERRALVACAVFEAPFDAALAEEVVRITEVDALDALETLRRRALLETSEPDESGRPMLRLLESVRDFVREQPELDALAIRRRYAEALSLIHI